MWCVILFVCSRVYTWSRASHLSAGIERKREGDRGIDREIVREIKREKRNRGTIVYSFNHTFVLGAL